MDDAVPLYSATIPLAFFVWAPVAVMLLFWLVGLYAGRLRVPRALESDWNGFSVADVEKAFAAFGTERLARYRHRILPADAAFALVYATVGALIVYGLAGRGQPWWIAALCGGGWLFGGLCDVAENLGLARIIDKYPKVEQGDVAFASGFTRLKLVLFVAGIVGALVACWLVFRPLAA